MYNYLFLFFFYILHSLLHLNLYIFPFYSITNLFHKTLRTQKPFLFFFFSFFFSDSGRSFFYWSKHWQLFFIFNRSHVWFNIATIGNFLSTPLPLLPRPACTLLALCINSSKLNNFVLKPWFTTQKGKKQFVKKNEIENKVNVIV